MKNPFAKNKHLSFFTALEKRFLATGDIADRGERLLELEDIRKQNEAYVKEVRSLPELIFVTSMWIGLVTMLALQSAPVIGGGIMFGLALVGAMPMYLIVPVNGKKCMDLTHSIASRTEDGIKKMINDDNPMVMAQSPKFETVMKAFPVLKEKFMLAAAKQAAQFRASRGDFKLDSRKRSVK